MRKKSIIKIKSCPDIIHTKKYKKLIINNNKKKNNNLKDLSLSTNSTNSQNSNKENFTNNNNTKKLLNIQKLPRIST